MKVNLLVFILLMALLNPPRACAQMPFKDFLGMKGNLVKHPYREKSLSASVQYILELRNNSGIPIWFAFDAQKVVCLSRNCRPLNLWLFWDGTGEYLGFQLYRDEPLTKTDHADFELEDYEKLHLLLSDSGSVLKNIEYESLILVPENASKRVDAYSGATRLSLREYLVKDAAYTCYTLWHMVHGPIHSEILKILDDRANDSYLRTLFDQEDPKFRRWAIGFVKRYSEYHGEFVQTIMDQIKNDDNLLSKQALNYFESDYLNQPEIQKKLASAFDKFPHQRQFELLWKLEACNNVYDETITILLEMFARNKIKVDLLGYVYNLIRSQNLNNKMIVESIKRFLNHENLYVRTLTKRLLE